MCKILIARFRYPVQEHERMGRISSDPNFFRARLDAELSRFQRYPKISSSHRGVSEIAVGVSSLWIDRLRDFSCFPGFPVLAIIRIFGRFDAPARRAGTKQESLALFNR